MLNTSMGGFKQKSRIAWHVQWVCLKPFFWGGGSKIGQPYSKGAKHVCIVLRNRLVHCIPTQIDSNALYVLVVWIPYQSKHLMRFVGVKSCCK